MKDRRALIWKIAAGVYAAAVLYLLFLQRWADFMVADDYWARVGERLNLTPFDSFRCFFTVAHWGTAGLWQAAANLLGNVVLFVPLGVFLPHFFPAMRKFGWLLLAATGDIVLMEAVQLLTLLGAGDIDDVMLNLAGTLLGFGIWQLCRRRRAHRKTTDGEG